ncbi:MAG: carbohydrate porin [Candidatus Sericytochromatia bacterium]|nr:carbohydrate porin [Candidatus Sericytochromatia bacterium]
MKKKLIYSLIILTTLGFLNDAKADEVKNEAKEDWSFHYQFTNVIQGHPDFYALYSGKNSLKNTFEIESTITSTLYLGRRLWNGAGLYFNPEISGGSGISSAQGIAGFSNGEAFRVGDPKPAVYIGRLFIRQDLALDNKTEELKDEANQLLGVRPISRLTFSLGKMGLTDIFDNNSYSHDPRTQFLNWSLMAPGAWDYAADTRGYTWMFTTELHQIDWSVLFAAAMVPTEANGLVLDLNISKAHSLNLEFDKKYNLFGQDGVARLIGFYNSAMMDNYRRAINLKQNNPELGNKDVYNSKFGFALNLEQNINEYIGTFAKLSWNDGNNQTWMFTEIDHSGALGLNLAGKLWSRKDDNIGASFVINGISSDHKDYLANGGLGFIIGDGKLKYAPESIFETYYNFKLNQNINLSADYQLVLNPAYNSDRGLVNIFGLRTHIEF